MPVECEKCGGLTTQDITPLSCSACNAFYHLECVDLLEDGEVKDCMRCVAKGPRKRIQDNIPLAPKSLRSRKAISHRSASSRGSKSSKDIQKEIELLEIRRNLELRAQEQLQREREKYFEEKQQFIKDKLASDLKYATEKTLLEKELECNEELEVSSVTSSQLAEERIQAWKNGMEKAACSMVKDCDPPKHSASNNVEASIFPPIGSSTILIAKNDSQHVTKNPPNAPECNATFVKQITDPIAFHNEKSIAAPDIQYKYVTLPFNRFQHDNQTNLNRVSQDEFNVNKDSQKVVKYLSREALAARNSDMKNLPTYTGKAKEWPAFLSQFEQSTELCQYSDVDNLLRLKNCLQGNAKKAVDNALSHPGNVKHIINTLRQLFGRPEFILNELLQDVRELPPVKIDKFDDIIHMSILVANMCSTMISAKMSDHLWNPLLLQELMTKLPTQLKREWAQFRTSMPSVNLETFSFWISQRSAEYSWLLTEPPNFTDSKSKKNVVNLHDLETCLVCQGSCMSIGSCKQFEEMSYTDKWSFVKSRKLCRTCLKSHKGKCGSSQICGFNGCPYKHHVRLHKPNVDNDSNRSNTAVVNSHSSDLHEVLLKILPITLQNGDNIVHTYALLDDGSSVTLIEQWVADELKSEGVPDELCLKWTGDTHKVEQNSKRISVSISGGQQTFTLSNARTVEKLDLPRQTISREKIAMKFRHLKNIPFKSYEEQQPAVRFG